jgi:hypothetical protein
MYTIKNESVKDIVKELNNNGWKGDSNDFLNLIQEINDLKNNVFENYFEKNDIYQFCNDFIFHRSNFYDSKVNVYIFDEYIVISEKDNYIGLSVDMNFDKFIKTFIDSEILSINELKKKKFILKTKECFRRLSEIHYNFEDEHFYTSNLSFKLPFDINELD